MVNDPEVSPTLCFPGKKETADAVARITGKTAGSLEDIVAVVHCARIRGNVHKKYNYIGYGDCSGANLAFAGPTECQYGCVGFGECSRACPFDAITLVDHFPEIDSEACVGCGACVRTCPKHLISLQPSNIRVLRRCSTKDTAKEVKAICEVGCIHCRLCIKKCPAEAISMVDDLIVIDHVKCIQYGPACEEACMKACKPGTLQPAGIKQTDRTEEQQAASGTG